MTKEVYINESSIRLVLTGSCQSGCNFCHLEGNRPAGYSALHPDIAGWKEKKQNMPLIQRLSYPINTEDVRSTVKLAKLLKIPEIHLTGGEPTLHPNVCEFITLIHSSGLRVEVTTHGEYSNDMLRKVVRANLDGIVFSVHCTTEEEYLSMDLVAQEIQERYGLDKALLYSKSRLEMKKRNILHALKYKNLLVRANHVVRDSSAAIGVIHFSNKHDLEIRLQRNANKREESDIIINEIIAILKAKKIGEEYSYYDSTGGISTYQYSLVNGYKGIFKIKSFSKVYFPLICDSCVFKGTNQCREMFYGIRAQHNQIRVCIDRHDDKVLYSFNDILSNKNGIVTELKKQYHVLESN